MKMRIRYRAAIAVVLTAAVVCGVVGYIDRTAQVGTKPAIERQIVIDAGHGGEDGGAEGLYNLVEKNINLSIALKLRDMLALSGFDVIMTRSEDISIYDDSANTTREKKRSDIKKRLEIANGNPNAIMVSIHQNKFEQSQYSGAQMFYGLQNELSQPLAECLQKRFVANIQPDNAREIKPIPSSVYLIHKAKIPAVLAECGFLSNPDEAKKLSQEEYQNQVAFTLYCGIVEFYDQSIG